MLQFVAMYCRVLTRFFFNTSYLRAGFVCVALCVADFVCVAVCVAVYFTVLHCVAVV